MPQARIDPVADEEVPWSNYVTPYDEAHLVTYLCLLNASGDGASESEMARSVLGIDPEYEPKRAQKAVRSHLKRALWMTDAGYRSLLECRA